MSQEPERKQKTVHAQKGKRLELIQCISSWISSILVMVVTTLQLIEWGFRASRPWYDYPVTITADIGSFVVFVMLGKEILRASLNLYKQRFKQSSYRRNEADGA
ncbi:MAG: hypothetical protein H0U76_10995 [Ktedonobacteraceae bacterium]|nr:hypothetical protein [Ktedonobacteraceae bacterium]